MYRYIAPEGFNYLWRYLKGAVKHSITLGRESNTESGYVKFNFRSIRME